MLHSAQTLSFLFLFSYLVRAADSAITCSNSTVRSNSSSVSHSFPSISSTSSPSASDSDAEVGAYILAGLGVPLPSSSPDSSIATDVANTNTSTSSVDQTTVARNESMPQSVTPTPTKSESTWCANTSAPSIGQLTTSGPAPLNASDPTTPSWTNANASYASMSSWANDSISIAPTGIGLDYASRCASLSLDYWEGDAYWDWQFTRTTSDTTSCSYYSTPKWTGVATEYYPSTWTSACLGTTTRERIIAGSISTTYKMYAGEDTTRCWRSKIQDPYPTPPPSCSYGLEDCNSLWLDYDASTKAMKAASDDGAALEISTPACSSSLPSLYCSACTIFAFSAEVLYWPPNVIGTDICDPERRFITQTPTISGLPNTAVYGDMTMTSPSLYISLNNLAAWSEDAPVGCGGQYENTIIAMPPEDLSSIRYSYWLRDETPLLDYHYNQCTSATAGIYPYDYNDLLGAISFDKMNGTFEAFYAAQQYPLDALDETNYSPRLVVPQQLRDLDPLWSNCGLEIDGLWDPPVPLVPGSTVRGVSSLGPTASTTAVETSESLGQTAEPAGQPTGTLAGKSSVVVTEQTTAAVLRPVSGGPVATVSPASQSQTAASNDPIGGKDPANAFQSLEKVIVSVIVQVASAVALSQSSKMASIQANLAPDPQRSGALSAPASDGGFFQSTAGQIIPISAQSSAGGDSSVVGGSQGAASQSVSRTTKANPVLVTIDSRTLIAIMTGPAVVLQADGVTITLQAGDVAVLDGRTISNPGIVGSKSVTILDANSNIISAGILGSVTESPASAATLKFVHGGVFTAVQHDGTLELTGNLDYPLVLKNSSTLRLFGQQLSVASDGSFVVLDRSTTIPLTQPSRTQYPTGYVLVVDGTRTISLDSEHTGLSGLQTSVLPDGRTTVVTADGRIRTLIKGTASGVAGASSSLSTPPASSRASSSRLSLSYTSVFETTMAIGLVWIIHSFGNWS